MSGDIGMDMGVNDRGAMYGDGLFETMRAHRGDVPWWARHWARLRRGADALRIALPDEQLAHDSVRAALRDGPIDAVLKLRIARGGAGRGYAPASADVPASLHLSTHALPDTPDAIAVRWCATQLALQPALAGHKHCNRLEQVLARLEWGDGGAEGHDAFEGLMCSTRGDVVCAVAANVFVHVDGRWLTPCIDRCGVAGVMRGWVLEHLDVAQRRIRPDMFQRADAVFLTNAVRGILPVARLGMQQWAPHDDIAALRRRLAAAHPGFAID